MLLAVAPGIFLMAYFFKRDRHEPEPPKKVIKVMFWGALCAIPAVIMELVAMAAVPTIDGGLVDLAVQMFLIVALSEELCKYWVVKYKIYHDPELDEPFDGIVYCVAASLGFAIFENILYVIEGGFVVGLLRAVMSIPAHALFAVFMGYYLGLSKFAPDEATRRSLLRKGLFVAVFSHGLYDFVLSVQIPMVQLTVLPLMGVFWAVGLAQVRKHLLISPHTAQQPAANLQQVGDALGQRVGGERLEQDS